MTWETDAKRLAARVTHPGTRWRDIVSATPRHTYVPAWWERIKDGTWVHQCAELRSPEHSTYANRSLVTQVGPHHADVTRSDSHPVGRPTSSATEPGLTLRMLGHAALEDGHDLLEIGTGSGYGTALACAYLGEGHVTSVDVDRYLTRAAARRLGTRGHTPTLHTLDATGPLPDEGRWDRIVSTVAVPTVPSSWLTALAEGGRLVTALAGTTLLLTANRRRDGSAVGRIEWDRAGFMATRTGPDYEDGVPDALRENAWHDEGDTITASPLPVIDVEQAWDLASMLALQAPGIEHGYHQEPDGRRVAIMTHPDGSWARAESKEKWTTSVHQSGPRQLWDLLDDIRHRWLHTGELPVRGAHAVITPDGALTLSRGGWSHTLS